MDYIPSNNIIFGIVCFREKFWQCTSFLTLLKSYESQSTQSTIDIIVFDNTDLVDWIEDIPSFNTNINVLYFANKSNPGISVAYNEMHKYAVSNGFDWIVFFDQDTNLPLETYSIYKKASLDFTSLIKIPIVLSKNKIISPSRYIFYRSYLFQNIPTEKLKIKNISCINSGLMVNTGFFTKVGKYNETLRLDFCDHEFISRAKNYTDYLNIVSLKLFQNFSVDTNSIEKALFRYDLFIEDLKAFKKINKNYKVVTFFIDLPHVLRLTIKYKSYLFLKKRLLSI